MSRQTSIARATVLASFVIALSGLSTTRAKDADAPAAPISNEPQQTSATFGDWVVRCDRPSSGQFQKRVCEVAQSLVVKGQQAPIAQIAFGYGVSDKPDGPLLLTVALPVNISFDKAPALGAAPGPDDPRATKLTFRRCLPGGCFADAKPDAAFMKELRGATKPGHISFTDASERTLTLPLSFRGLAQALDNLVKENAASR